MQPSAYKDIPVCRADVGDPVIIKAHLQETFSKARALCKDGIFDSETAAHFAESRQPTTIQNFTSTPVAIDPSHTARTGAYLLDLGSWMSLQSTVENIFADEEALVRKIEDTWNVYDSMIFRRNCDR